MGNANKSQESFAGKRADGSLRSTPEDLLNRGDFTKNVEINVDDIVMSRPKETLRSPGS